LVFLPTEQVRIRPALKGYEEWVDSSVRIPTGAAVGGALDPFSI
jgi:hypothetical protein